MDARKSDKRRGPGGQDKAVDRRPTGCKLKFFCKDHFCGAGQVAIDLIAMADFTPPNSRRLVDFVPPRRYAHYLVQGGWLFLSGMAEQGEDIDIQYAAIISQIEKALSAEAIDWSYVKLIQLYVERDCVDEAWLMKKLRTITAANPELITIQTVDGLASQDKHLEIEVIASSSR